MSNIIQIKRGTGEPNGKLAPYELGINTENYELFVGGPLVNEDGTSKYGAAQGITVQALSKTLPIDQGGTGIDNEADLKKFILNIIYPVGSIYISMNNISPSTFIGGEWEQIQGRFLLSASDNYEIGAEGGEAEVTLTKKQMPSHIHGLYTRTVYASGGNYFGISDLERSEEYNETSEIMGSAGGNEAHNNMPPYLVVYMWKRTS